MQQRNFIIFVTLSIAILAGWTWMQQYIWPPPPTKDGGDKIAEVKKAEPEKEPQAKQDDKAPPQAKVNLRELIRKQPLILLPATVATAAATNGPPLLATLVPFIPDAKPATPAAQAAAAPKLITLGGEGYHIEAELTTQGAGVSRLTLTHFEEANWLGQPAGRRLDLIPRDPFQPSYVMYHYQEPGASAPVFGMGEQLWEHESTRDVDGGQEARFSTHVPGMEHLKITKVYGLKKDTYHLDLRLEIADERPRGESGVSSLRYQLTGGHGLPIEGVWYTSVFRNSVIGIFEPPQNLWRTLEDSGTISHRQGGDRSPTGNRHKDTLVQYAGVLNQFFGALIVVSDQQPKPEDGGVRKEDIVAWARPTQESAQVKGVVVKIGKEHLDFEAAPGRRERYLLLPHMRTHLEEVGIKEGDKAVLNFSETPDGKLVATWAFPGQTLRPMFDDITVRVISEVVQLKAGERVAHQFLLYHGPVKTALLRQFGGEKAVPDELVTRYTDTLHLRTLTDYPASAIGRFFNHVLLVDFVILMTRVMHTLLYWLSFLVPSYGIAIILLTVVVRGLMHPISRRQAYFSIKMQELAPKMKEINERYKNDPQAKTQAVMELYRRHKIHPLGSCLPLFLQMPIFLGLYFALQESIHFRLASFLWMDNLAAPDMLLWWTQSIPFISDADSMGGVFYLGPFLNVLPIIAVVLMMIQQQLMTPPPTDEQQEAQQKMMKYMTVFFGILFYKVASGLCIYFIASSLWGLAERQLLPKKKTALAAADVPPSPGYGGAPASRPKPKPGRGRPQGRDKGENGVWGKVKDWWAEVLKQAEKK